MINGQRPDPLKRQRIFILKSNPAYIAVCRLWLMVVVKELACAWLVSTGMQMSMLNLLYEPWYWDPRHVFGMLSSVACQALGMLLHAYACRVRLSRSRKAHLEHLSRICRTLVGGSGSTSINTLNLCDGGERGHACLSSMGARIRTSAKSGVGMRNSINFLNSAKFWCRKAKIGG